MYQLIKHYRTEEIVAVRRLQDGACIPFDEGNQDYQDYLNWIAKGNTPDPAPVEPADEQQ